MDETVENRNALELAPPLMESGPGQNAYARKAGRVIIAIVLGVPNRDPDRLAPVQLRCADAVLCIMETCVTRENQVKS